MADIPSTTLKGYLSEEQRANLLTYSEALDNATGGYSENGVTITLNNTTSPTGELTGTKMLPDVGTGTRGLTKNVSGLTDDTFYTLSIFIKKNDYQWSRLATTNKDTSSASTYFDVQNGVLGTIGSGHTAKIEEFNDGWYRCSISVDIKSGGTTPSFYIRICDNNEIASATGDGTKHNFFWGAQLEEGTFASSYVKTTTAAVTRTADALSYPATGNITQGQGSIVCEFNQLGIDGGTKRIFELNSGDSSNRIMILSQETEEGKFKIDTSSTEQVNIESGDNAYIYGIASKIGLSYKNNAVSGFIDGTNEGSDTSSTISTGITTIYIGCSDGTGVEANANVKNVKIFNEALDDSVMENKTQ